MLKALAWGFVIFNTLGIIEQSMRTTLLVPTMWKNMKQFY